MSIENPIGKRAEDTVEVSPAEIESAESRLGVSTARLQEALISKSDTAKIEDPDTREKIKKAWDSAKLRAFGAFDVLFGVAAGATIWTGETYNAAQASLQGGDLEEFTNLSRRVAQLQSADVGLMAAAVAVPLLMLGMSKFSKLQRERNLNSATS